MSGQGDGGMPLPDFGQLINENQDPGKPLIPDFGKMITGANAPDPNNPFSGIDRVNEENRQRIHRLANRMGVGPEIAEVVSMIPEAYFKGVAWATTPSVAIPALGRTARSTLEFGERLIPALGGGEKGYVEEFKESGRAVGDLAHGIYEGMILPLAVYPAELLVGQGLDNEMPENPEWEIYYDAKTGEQRRRLLNPVKLTPEERAAKARSFVANLAGVVVGNAAGRAAEVAVSSQRAVVGGRGLAKLNRAISRGTLPEALDQMPTTKLMDLAEASATPHIVSSVAGGTAEAVAGGFTVGALDTQGTQESLDAALAYTLIALPIGLAHSSISNIARKNSEGVRFEDVISAEAGKIAQHRQLVDVVNNSPIHTVKALDNLADTQDLAVSLLSHHVDMIFRTIEGKSNRRVEYGINAGVIPNVVDPVRINAEVARMQAAGLPVVSVNHVRRSKINGVKESVVDVLIAPNDIRPEHVEFFKRTGYAPGQQIGYAGSDRYVIDNFTPPVKVVPEVKAIGIDAREMVGGEWRSVPGQTNFYNPLVEENLGIVRKKLGLPNEARLSEVVDKARGLGYDGIVFEISGRVDAIKLNPVRIPTVTSKDRIRLRHLDTGAIVEDVRPRKLSRLPTMEIGGSVIMQNRKLATVDVFERGLGLSKGSNSIYQPDPSLDPYEQRMTQEGMQYNAVAEVQAVTGGTVRKNSHGNWSHSVYGELKPGINHIEAVQTNGQKAGNIVYMGGKMGIDPETGKEVMIGKPNEFVAVVTWQEGQAKSGKWALQRGSTGYYSDVNQPYRKLATNEIGKERIVGLGIKASFSTLSPGSAWSLAHNRNLYDPIKVKGAFTIADAKVIRNALYQDFLEFIGFDGERPRVPNDQEFDRPGFYSEYWGGSVIGQRGETVRDIAERQQSGDQNRLDVTENATKRRVYSSSEGSTYTERDVTDIMREQNDSRLVPELREQGWGNLNHAEHNLDSMMDAFIEARALNPELRGELKNFFASTLARELLGIESPRTRGALKDALPFLKERLEEIPKIVKAIDDRIETTKIFGGKPVSGEKLFGVEIHDLRDYTDWRQQLLDTQEVFKRRVELLEDPTPVEFSAKERELYQRVVDEAEAERRASDTLESDSKELVRIANSSGYMIERSEGGNFILRDRETNAPVGPRFNSPEVARDFINESGRPSGIDLDDRGRDIVPPSTIIGPALSAPDPAPRAWEAPHSIAPLGRVGTLIAFLDSSFAWYTSKRSFFAGIDGLMKGDTQLFAKVYLPLQMQKLRVDSIKRPHLEAVKKIEQGLIDAGINAERRQIISDNRETMSAEEVINKHFPDRPLNDREVLYGRQMAKDNIDLPTVYSYRRAVKEIRSEYVQNRAQFDERLRQNPNDADATQKIIELEQQLNGDILDAQQAFNMDGKHLRADKVFDQIAMRSKDMNLGAIVRLANAIMNKSMTRAEHAAFHKITDRELIAIKEVDLQYAKLAKVFGIDNTIGGYLNHYRNFKDIPEQGTVRLGRGAEDIIPSDRVQEFASRVARSGELNLYERDPINALVQYINAGFNDLHFNDAHRQAMNDAAVELQKIPHGRGMVTRVVNDYLDGMKGIPTATDSFIKSAFSTFLEKLGVESKGDPVGDLVKMYGIGTSGSMLGFRPAQGARDFQSFSKIYITRFGLERWQNAWELARKRDSDGISAIQKLAESGEIPGLGVIEFLTEQEIQNSMAGNTAKGRVWRGVQTGITKGAEAGLKASLQQNAYALAHAMAYLDTKDLSTKTLLKLSRNEITKGKAYEILKINGYDLPAAIEFDRLVTAGDFDAASTMLAHNTGAETAFMYGMQNQPYLWRNMFGRLAGQYGVFSMWNRNHLARIASRGSPKERAMAMGRYAIVEGATYATGKITGFNMSSWYGHSGLFFTGGPLVQQIQDLEDMAGGNGKLRQQFAQNRYTNNKGTVPPYLQWVPGASAVNDYVQAFKLNQNRYGIIPVLGRGIGFSVNKGERSIVDEMLGIQPIQ